MKKIKIYALSAVALGGMFLIGSLMHSRDSQAKGAYSTPVSVMNTSSAPAIGSTVDEPGRIPYVSVSAMAGSNCQVPVGECNFAFTPVPAGHRLVLQQVSGDLQTHASASPAFFRVTITSTGLSYSGAFTVNASSVPTLFNLATFNQLFVAHFDAGDTPHVFVDSFNTIYPNDSTNESVVLKGYLIDCSAAPCASIVH